MTPERKQELHDRLGAYRRKHGPHAFAKHYSSPEQIARLAYNTTAIERRNKDTL